MNKEQIKQAVCAAIDAHAEEIIAIGDDIFAHPELGYKEVRTSGIVRDTFDKLGLPHEDGLAITGVKARLKGNGEGPPSPSWVNWTPWSVPCTPTPIRTPAPRTPAGITGRLRPCWGRRTGLRSAELRMRSAATWHFWRSLQRNVGAGVARRDDEAGPYSLLRRQTGTYPCRRV